MKIIRLQAENIKKLVAIDIQPEGHVVKITGKNEQGKTTVLDSIFWALGGTKAIQEEPIRQGETKASIRLELDDLVITRTFTPGNSYLKVENKNGASFKSPQAMLDKLVGRLSFDPLAFAQADVKTQRNLLLQVTGFAVDADRLQAIAGTVMPGETALDILNATYKAVFDERTLINRQLDQAKKSSASASPVSPTEAVSIADLMRAYREQQVQVTAAQANERQRHQWEDQIDTWTLQVHELQQEIEILESKILEAQVNMQLWTPVSMPDLSAIETQIAQAEDTNRQAAAYAAYQQAQTQMQSLQSTADLYTSRLSDIKAYQQDLVAQAQFPIEGLGFANGGVTSRRPLQPSIPCAEVASLPSHGNGAESDFARHPDR